MTRKKLAAPESGIALECALSQFQKAAHAVILGAFVIRQLILEPEINGPYRTRRIAAGALELVRCFAALVEGGSLSRAAEILGLSQPTISVTLTGLERACGSLLFYRRPRIALTDAGQDLLARARLVLGRMDELENTMQQSRDLSRGSIAIGLSTPAHAMPCIAALMAAYPEVRIRTRLPDQAAMSIIFHRNAARLKHLARNPPRVFLEWSQCPVSSFGTLRSSLVRHRFCEACLWRSKKVNFLPSSVHQAAANRRCFVSSRGWKQQIAVRCSLVTAK